MPRRARPVSRRPPSDRTNIRKTVPFNSLTSDESSKRRDELESQSEDKSDTDSSDHSSSSAAHVPPPDEDENVEAPRVAQWVDEDDLDEWSSFNNEPSKEDSDREATLDDDEGHELTSLQHDLATIPLGALRKAQRELARTRAGDDGDESFNDTDPASEPESIPHNNIKSAEKPEWSNKPRMDIPRRKDKNAPTEVTSKRPVTRRRQIIDVPKIEPQDPRFLPFSGQLRPETFRKQYEFLSDLHVSELNTLKEHLKRAKKLLISSPRHLREEREQEVVRLELAFKKAESSVNRDRRQRVEQEALAKAKKEENDKRKTGKGAWYMKDADKKRLLIRARYDALAADGGKMAVKKVIEKKQRKVGQKEKKRRPSGDAPRKRKRNPDQERGVDSRKRRKVE